MVFADAAIPAVTRVGFIGVGKMGLPMIGHLHAAGFAVTAFDPLPDNRSQAMVAGCMVAPGIAACVAAADVMMSSLPNDAALGAVAAAIADAARTGVPVSLAAQVRQMYQALTAQGDGDLDYIATVRLVERMAGIGV